MKAIDVPEVDEWSHPEFRDHADCAGLFVLFPFLSSFLLFKKKNHSFSPQFSLHIPPTKLSSII